MRDQVEDVSPFSVIAGIRQQRPEHHGPAHRQGAERTKDALSKCDRGGILLRVDALLTASSGSSSSIRRRVVITLRLCSVDDGLGIPAEANVEIGLP